MFAPDLIAAADAPGTDADVADAPSTTIKLPWRVILFNDDIHSFDEVILQLMKATRCSSSEAETIAWRAHMEGKARAYEGTFEECFRVNGILREIQLVTEIEG